MFRGAGVRIGVQLWRTVLERSPTSLATSRVFDQRVYSSARALWSPSVELWRGFYGRQYLQGQSSSLNRSRPHGITFSTLSRTYSLTKKRAWDTRRPAQASVDVLRTARSAWRRRVHHKTRRKSSAQSVRNRSSASKETTDESARLQSVSGKEPSQTSPPSSRATEQDVPGKPVVASKSIWDSLPQMPHNIHRPSKEELLAAATGFWSRLRAHFKWFTIRSGRPFNADEITALFSWVVLGHFLWILVGTTTFFSLAIFIINTVFAQEALAQWVGNYLTRASGLKVVFESAVVPKWKNGTIQFKKVFVSRRPGQGKAKVSKGSQAEAAAAAANAALAERIANGEEVEEEDTNYTQFDLSLDTVSVTLSFAKWFNGKGLLKDVEINGVRGVIDRTSVQWSGEPVDPKSYRTEHFYGDFELESFKMSDLLVTLYQPRNFRPFTISIYQCDLPQLRKQWIFYDFLSANTISGSFDNSLFTIHPRQTHNYTGLQLDEGAQWKKHSRIRIDGINIDHLNREVEGPFSWIHEGNVDIVADILLPHEDDGSIAKVMSDFYDRVEATVTSPTSAVPVQSGSQNIEKAKEAKEAAEHGTPIHARQDLAQMTSVTDEDSQRFLIMDLRVHFNDVRATVPIFTKDITYVNNALIRPIVAYINSRRSFIPVNCRVVKPISDFDGSWTIFDSGLMDDLSQEMYDAFARDVINDKQNRKRRFRKVGVWTLQLAAQALFLGLAGNVA